MGRWLVRLQQEEKNANTLGSQTLKTFETPSGEVLRVLKVPHPGKFENFLPDDVEREERLADYGETAKADGADTRKFRATEAGDLEQGNQSQTPAAQSVEGGDRARRKSADKFQSRPADWMPEPSPGISILRPAVELYAVEYDKHLDVLIAALPAGSVEAQRLAFAKRKGWVVECGGRRIFTRGRF